jgi:crotonobetainyl-CoA:carnitine CoA-transferase CaiB-like acyl-CoA transferase
MLAGQILADLGADVIQVEPPGGSSARAQPPFVHGAGGDDSSLFWWAYARNKRGITCDIESPEGQDLIRRLIAGADFVIESDRPDAMAARGLGYADITTENPALIYASITPWGQDGPKAHYAASDLILMAAGGPLILSGTPGEPPTRCAVPQAYHHAAADAAGGMLIALTERRRSGVGQHVDVAAVSSVAAGTQSLILAHAIGDQESTRASGGAQLGHVRVRVIWPCKDGWVSLTLLFGSAAGPFTQRLMAWAHEEGMCSDTDLATDWVRYGARLFSGDVPMADHTRVQGVVEAFLKTRTKAECLQQAQARRLLLVPVMAMDDVAASPQLAARAYWRDVERPDGVGTVRFPGPFVRVDDRPIAYRRRAPQIGEHNAEIYGELGLDAGDLIALQEEGIIS